MSILAYRARNACEVKTFMLRDYLQLPLVKYTRNYIYYYINPIYNVSYGSAVCFCSCSISSYNRSESNIALFSHVSMSGKCQRKYSSVQIKHRLVILTYVRLHGMIFLRHKVASDEIFHWSDVQYIYWSRN